MTSDKLPNINELSVKAEKIYHAIPEELLHENQGRFVAIELDSGECFFGDNKDIAVTTAKNKHPGKIVFIRRVGHVEKIQSFHRVSALIQGKQLGSYAGIL